MAANIPNSKEKVRAGDSIGPRPNPRESFSKFQRKCPYHKKARCGRCFCNHAIWGGKKNVRCTKLTCPFFGKIAEAGGKKRKERTEYRIPRRYRGALMH